MECILANCKHIGTLAHVLLMGLYAAELHSTVSISLSYHLEIIQHNIVWNILNSIQTKNDGDNFKSNKSCINAKSSVNANLRLGRTKLFSSPF